ncbi:MAG: bifunctional diaminohydroxyphosphoribosylaminopyrimidine deaminase/5-amino-6-(5-phosphoribosylamino)uracil reductase RibD [Dehalococcoidia bacterium]|nr:bifunctional diaminohydroxyphosphoribosylaminopyrimidine deaminase/5-amino-6-(5-phosphoribosylamino)uracil reductase RibD [Dehalococcoidia bacterium]
MPRSEPMRQAIAAALSARGRTSPNPWVGAVLVRDGEVIATGATAPPGGPHAEAAALANIDATGATLYTTLEPCMPFPGKRTRPCAEVIAEAGVAKVVIGLEDPHEPVAGQGAAYLRSHGIDVETGDGADEVRALLRPYLKHVQTRLPYVIAKFAVSLDGKAGAPAHGVRWLTSEPARARAHADRAWVDAIAVGSGTVLADDPALTARPGGQLSSHQPVRVILDARGRISTRAMALGPGAIVATASSDRAWAASITATGAMVIQVEPSGQGLNLDQLLTILGERSVLSLILEGGPTLLASAFAAGVIDEVHAYIAPMVLGPDGLPLFAGDAAFAPEALQDVEIELLHPDVLVRGYTANWTP